MLAMVHGCVGPAFFALCAVTAVLTSRRGRTIAHSERCLDRSTYFAALISVALVYFQILLGAIVRHMPLAADPAHFRLAVLFHVAVGLFAAGQLMILTWRVLGHARGEAWLSRPAMVLAALMGIQLLLGMATWVVKYAFPAQLAGFDFAAGYTISASSMLQSLVVTAHVATGSLVLATSALLATRAACLRQTRTKPVPFELSARGLAL
jgi:cytochrome c oxidase assembly protein subunit 15